MSLQLKVYAGMFAAGGLFMAASAVDLSMNYTKVNARVTKSTTDCYVENSSGKLVERETDQLAYMDCDFAPFAAKMHGYDEGDIHRRSTYEFVYNSPVDGSRQKGEATDRHAAKGEYARGKVVTVYGHKTEPAKYRTGL